VACELVLGSPPCEAGRELTDAWLAETQGAVRLKAEIQGVKAD